MPGERTGPEGRRVSNRLLLALPNREFRALRPALELRKLKHQEVLHEPHVKVDRVYFPNAGLIALVIAMANGKTVEAGVLGNEGIVGLEGMLGLQRGPLREIVQAEGTAYCVSAPRLERLVRRFPTLLVRFSRFAIVNRMQISQTAACNRLHDVESRLARWLLLLQDRVNSAFIPVTHEFVATMLGTDRGSVTHAAGILQKHKIIEYTRGSLRILNRKELERFSCECYALIREYNSDLIG